jgi:hypothetical protein
MLKGIGERNHAQNKKKKRKIAHVQKREKKERDGIMQKGVPINLMVITSTRSGPSVHRTITTTFIIYMVISSTHSKPSIHLTISITSIHLHILI